MAAKDVTASHDENEPAAQLMPEQLEARLRLMKLAEEQGVKPMTLEKLKAMGAVWPEDESIDDFIATIRKRRDEEGDDRELP